MKEREWTLTDGLRLKGQFNICGYGGNVIKVSLLVRSLILVYMEENVMEIILLFVNITFVYERRLKFIRVRHRIHFASVLSQLELLQE